MQYLLKYLLTVFFLILSHKGLTAGDSVSTLEVSPTSSNSDHLDNTSDYADIIIKTLSDLVTLFNRANQTFSYRSLLTYEANGYITTYRLHHRFKDKQIQQQLFFMDGLPREVVRQQGIANCQLGDVSVGLWSIPQPEAKLSSYEFKVQGTERVADRNAVIFDIIPKDEYRYGYRYSVDKSTGLVLKVITYDKEKIIERLQTVSLELVNNDAWPAEKTAASYVWRVPELEPCQTEQYQTVWQVDWLPPGFELVGTRLTAQGEQVLMYADGLVSLSIFVTNNVFSQLKKATARHGATVMVVAPVASEANQSIAVVGEVPVLTARRIARSVKAIK